MKKKLVAMLTALCCMAVIAPVIPVNAEAQTYSGSGFAILGNHAGGYAVMHLPSSHIKDKDGNIFYECSTFTTSRNDTPLQEGLSEYSAGDVVTLKGGWSCTELAWGSNYLCSDGELSVAGKVASVLDSEPVQMTITSFNPYNIDEISVSNMVGLSDGEKNYVYYRDWFTSTEDVPFGFDWKTVEVGDVIQFYTYEGFPVIAEKITGHEDAPQIAPPSPIEDNQTYSGICGENATWTLQNGTLTISGTGDMYNWTLGNIRYGLWEEDENGNVTDLYSASWYPYREKIRDIVIEEGITSIGDGAFAMSPNMRSIFIPDTVTRIGNSAFSTGGGYEVGNKLTSIEIPDSVTSIGEGAFYGCALTSVVIPDSVTEIGESAFIRCGNLTSAVLPNGLEVIPKEIFQGCGKLTDVSIPESVREIEENAFMFTPWLENQKAENPLVIVNDFVFDGTACEGEVIIPEGVERINSRAFYGNENNLIVKLPSTMKEIGNNAFTISGLSEITIPEGLTTIGNSAFSNTNLSNVVFPESLTEMGTGVFRNCDKLESVHFPSTMKEIPAFTFYGCHFKDGFTVQESIESIGEGAFSSVSAPKVNTKIDIVILNPNCQIYEAQNPIESGWLRGYYNVSGFECSTAQQYAEMYGFNFVSLGEYSEELPKGDIDNSGQVGITDVIFTNQCLLGVRKMSYRQKQAADVNGDKLVNDADSIHLLKSLVNLATIVE